MLNTLRGFFSFPSSFSNGESEYHSGTSTQVSEKNKEKIEEAKTKEMQVSSPNQLAIQQGDNFKKIANFASTALICTSNLNDLSTEDLHHHFWTHIKDLDIDKSDSYGVILRKAEEVLLILETREHNDQKEEEEIVNMRKQFQIAFQNIPAGSGQLTQLDVDHIMQMSAVPHGVICLNEKNIEFIKPEISISTLVTHFTQLGFTNVMYSREDVNFEGIQEICDVIMLGKKWEVSFWGNVNQLIDDAVHKVIISLEKEALFQKWGYQFFKIKLIKDLSETKKAECLMDQGLNICVILGYPEKQKSLLVE